MSWPIVLIVTAVTAVAVKTAGLYNRLVGRRNAVENAFSTIDVQIKQPCDLVPRVVAAVQGDMQYERDVLDPLTALRAPAEPWRTASIRHYNSGQFPLFHFGSAGAA